MNKTPTFKLSEIVDRKREYVILGNVDIVVDVLDGECHG